MNGGRRAWNGVEEMNGRVRFLWKKLEKNVKHLNPVEWCRVKRGECGSQMRNNKLSEGFWGNSGCSV